MVLLPVVPNLEFRKKGLWVDRTKPRGEATLEPSLLDTNMNFQSKAVRKISPVALLNPLVV